MNNGTEQPINKKLENAIRRYSKLLNDNNSEIKALVLNEPTFTEFYYWAKSQGKDYLKFKGKQIVLNKEQVYDITALQKKST